MAIQRKPRYASRKVSSKRAIARRLQFLTNGVISVDFDENSQFEGDNDSLNHLFSGFVSPECGEDFVCIDDRHGDVELQLIKELLRIGRFYRTLAADTAAKCGKQIPDDDEPVSLPIVCRLELTNQAGKVKVVS